jgi:hypothetical protein
MESDSCTTHIAQLLHNSNNYFLRLTIEYLWSICKKTNPMINYKKIKKIKKVVRVVQEILLNKNIV